jgi:DNA polymerase-1
MFLIIDGNNVAWAGYYALERAMKPETPERRARVALLGLAGMALGAIARGGTPPGAPAEPVSRVALCFDEGRPLRRRQMYPRYQMTREEDTKFTGNEPTILGGIAAFTEMATAMLPINVLRMKNTEADDLIAGLVAKHPGIAKRIVSGDRDFLQLIGPKTTIYSPIKKVVVDEGNFFEQTAPKTSSGERIAFPRERFLDYRTLVGDPSDTLAGVAGAGALSAAKLVAAAPLDAYFGDAAAVRAALGRRSEPLERAFADGSAAAVVERNRTLMDLRLPAPCWDVLDAATARGTWDRVAFEAWLREEKLSSVDPAVTIAQMERLAAAH